MDRLRLELSQARAETENLKWTMGKEGASNVVASERMLQPEPEIPLVGGFESPTASRIDSVRGAAHIHTVGAEVMESRPWRHVETQFVGQRITKSEQWEQE